MVASNSPPFGKAERQQSASDPAEHRRIGEAKYMGEAHIADLVPPFPAKLATPVGVGRGILSQRLFPYRHFR